MIHRVSQLDLFSSSSPLVHHLESKCLTFGRQDGRLHNRPEFCREGCRYSMQWLTRIEKVCPALVAKKNNVDVFLLKQFELMINGEGTNLYSRNQKMDLVYSSYDTIFDKKWKLSAYIFRNIFLNFYVIRLGFHMSWLSWRWVRYGNLVLALHWES